MPSTGGPARSSGGAPVRTHQGLAGSNSADPQAAGQEATPTQPVHQLMAGGDFMLSRDIPGKIAANGPDWPTRAIKPFLANADIALVNLECVISGRGHFADKGERRPFYYRCPPETVNALVAAGVTVVTTANNHTMDFGPDALDEQQRILSQVGIAAAGSGASLRDACRPIYLKAGDMLVAIISFATDQPRLSAAENQAGVFTVALASQALKTLEEVVLDARRHADLVVVSPHWGANWREQPSENIRRLAKSLIDLGTDAILGHSAHILQGVEVYRRKPIVYDMGSLLFDRVGESRLRHSALFEVVFTRDGIHQIAIRAVELMPGEIRLANACEQAATFELIEQLSRKLDPQLSFTRSDDTLRIDLQPVGIRQRTSEPERIHARTDIRPLPWRRGGLEDGNIFSAGPPPMFNPADAIDLGGGLVVFGACNGPEVRAGYGFLVEVYFCLRDGGGQAWRASIRGVDLVSGEKFRYRHPIAEGAWIPGPEPDERVVCDRIVVRPPATVKPGIYQLQWNLVSIADSKLRPIDATHPQVTGNWVNIGVISCSETAPRVVAGIR